ncbi:MAG: hypothetical protein IPM16_21575 [Chloroflexi bacterium]|nr:hypothetical protein [Chloroflexota bacterium]
MSKENSSSSLSRNDLVGLIWGCVIILILGMSGIVGFSGLSESVAFSDLLPVFAVALVSAAVATYIIIERVPDAARRSAAYHDETALDKTKNDQLTLSALNLLTDEDLEDLRFEIKQHLRERLLTGQDGELGGLDALIAERAQKSRRG